MYADECTGSDEFAIYRATKVRNLRRKQGLSRLIAGSMRTLSTNGVI